MKFGKKKKKAGVGGKGLELDEVYKWTYRECHFAYKMVSMLLYLGYWK